MSNSSNSTHKFGDRYKEIKVNITYKHMITYYQEWNSSERIYCERGLVDPFDSALVGSESSGSSGCSPTYPVKVAFEWRGEDTMNFCGVADLQMIERLALIRLEDLRTRSMFPVIYQ